MITANQLRAARALLNIDQRQTAELAGLSVPTIQRMEASDGVIRGNVDSLMKLVSALENAGIELINPGVASSAGGRGVRLREHVAKPKMKNMKQPKPSTSSPEFKQAEEQISALTKRLLSINGSRSVTSFHRELGKLMWDKCGMARSEASLKEALQRIPVLREEFWKKNLPLQPPK